VHQHRIEPAAEEERAANVAHLAEVAATGRSELVVARTQNDVALEHRALEHQAVVVHRVAVVRNAGAGRKMHEHRDHVWRTPQRQRLHALEPVAPAATFGVDALQRRGRNTPPPRLDRRQAGQRHLHVAHVELGRAAVGPNTAGLQESYSASSAAMSPSTTRCTSPARAGERPQDREVP
jgi:hypothetical protein